MKKLRISAATVLGCLFTIMMLGVTPASAHDQLDHTIPAAGAQLNTGPATVQLIFAEPALEIGSVIVVRGPGGVVSTGTTTVHGATVTRALTPHLVAGTYQVTWKVTSDDGHPVSGGFTFSVGANLPVAAAAPALISTAPPSPLRPWILAGAGLLAVTAALILARAARRR